MTLAIFDLDNTLIGGDSDNLWGEFVCEQELVDSADFAQRNEASDPAYRQNRCRQGHGQPAWRDGGVGP